MEGYEHPTRDASPHEIFRLSWLAYVGPIFTFLVLIAVSSGTSWLTIHKAQTDQAHQIGITISVLVLLLAFAMFIYKILVLRSVYLYTDDVGVWLYQGILPWRKGYRGVKWRDIEDAMYFTGFISWIFRSYTVRIGHRFTKTSEILITHLAKGNNAVEHINQLHQSILKAEQDEFLSPEV
ncbi:hypothetical protein ACDH60_27290 [Pseudomonas ficuserectae]|uniref:DUF304 domain-containing protein n=4 Tax=Pseudomonas syringae group TaxID=136849 RepID=A0A650D7Z1_PSESF|nr:MULTISPECIES: hypothetical protein [Pseudomonas syringae group]ARA80133.1 hypothetical protein B5U27_08705 [Pseudomonas amygdali pv. lachrymans]AXH56868.1 hypothetical protein PLA107_017340 [Pseudomonas amygdali pv. lachrymans str. M301315]AYL79947.1 hypothetical protein CN228_08270 [Pseudomonas syringae pv. actinidiae str. Shaanxi_M228]KKY51235.1 hypothetical protein AAY85_27875 [Pseudomonas amygdali pv. lachrymans]KPY14508.1 hypothetical protein ALO54_101070 [Pseudomonas syringae pv. phil